MFISQWLGDAVATRCEDSIMKRLRRFVAFGAALLIAPAAMALGQATPDEAKAMAIKAAEYLKANGPDNSFAAFNDKDGPWHDRDLYVIVQNDKGIMLMHGNNPSLAGKSVAALKDPAGKSISDEVIAIQDAGWVNFMWQNPLTHKLEPKTEYIVRVEEYRVGVGAYVQ
jgi:cytochrome c